MPTTFIMNILSLFWNDVHLKYEIATLSVHREESEVEFARTGQGNSENIYLSYFRISVVKNFKH